jgi:hypothetical protein
MIGTRASWMAGTVAGIVLAAGIGAGAEARLPHRLSGSISDYTPLNPTATPTGPWEMRGHWSLELEGRSGKADFSAFMTMELSDYWIVDSNSNAGDPTIRSAHTHHLLMTNATLSTDPSDLSSCPTFNPANSVLFVVSGTANFISGNGNSAPFEKKGPSKLQVCISGGTDGQSEVQYSNMTLTIAGPAAGHFGGQPIHGVVGYVQRADDGHQH